MSINYLPNQITDLFTTVQKVQRMLGAKCFPGGVLKDGSFNLAIQDGPEAGQTVPHVHCHIIPRLKVEDGGDGEKDGIYERLQGEEGNIGGGLWDVRPGGGVCV